MNAAVTTTSDHVGGNVCEKNRLLQCSEFIYSFESIYSITD